MFSKNNYILTHVVIIGNEKKTLSNVHSEGYRTEKLAMKAREVLINLLTTNKAGENIYYTSITGRLQDPERTLTIKEQAHTFKIQKLS